MTWAAYGPQHPSQDNIRWRAVTKRDNGHFARNRRPEAVRRWTEGAPPAGFEPALTAPEAVALSPELWGLCDTKGYQSQRRRGHVALAGAITARETLPSRE